MTAHEHEFHALSWHFGPYGPQDVHMHPCDCGEALQGEGRVCGGPDSPHHRVRYSERLTKWVASR